MRVRKARHAVTARHAARNVFFTARYGTVGILPNHGTSRHGTKDFKGLHVTWRAIATSIARVSRTNRSLDIARHCTAWIRMTISLAGLWPGQARCMHFTAYHSTLVCLQITAKLGTRDRFHVEIWTILHSTAFHGMAKRRFKISRHGTSRMCEYNSRHCTARAHFG